MNTLQPLPRLTYLPAPVPSTEVGEKGELLWLPLSSLTIDPIYQRAILDAGKANIRRMVEGFSWLLFGTLVVSRRGKNLYAVIDGQHRATAAMLHGRIREVPCLALKGGVEAEARAFSAIVALCAQAGVTIAPYPKTELVPGETLALGTVRICNKRYGTKIIVAALKLLRAYDGEAGLGASSIMGACDALSKNAAWAGDAARLGAALAARGGGLAGLVERARARKHLRGGTEWSNVAAVIAERLNAAQRTAGQPMSRLMAGR